VTESLARSLAAMGFTLVNAHLIERPRPDGVTWQLRCGARIDGTSKRPLVGMSAGLRIECVERFLGREQEPHAPTFSVPIHFLHEDRSLIEWDANDPHVVDVLVGEVQRYGVPFFERYERLEALLASLEPEDARKWVCVSRKERIELLIAVLAVVGKGAEAIAIADREIEALRGKPPAHRRQIERLRSKLRSGAGQDDMGWSGGQRAHNLTTDDDD
jgi:hypothetical protein